MKNMIVGKYIGTLDCNKGTIYIVVENMPDLIAKTIANTHFKVKVSDLVAQTVYMDNYDDDGFSFEDYPFALKAVAVFKRRNP